MTTALPIASDPNDLAAPQNDVAKVLGAGFTAMLWLLHAATYAYALVVIDAGRDISNAWLLSQGEAFPLTGPSIYGTWALGPVWYYLLAAPLWFEPHALTPVALWVGCLGSAKIPLAYLLGRRLFGPSGGALLAALIALPGWSSAEAMILAHTSVVESALLGALLLACYAADRPTVWRLAAAGLLLAMAMHAHPTAIAAAPWLAVVLLKDLPVASWPRTIAAAGVGFVLPWLPMLVSELQGGWQQLTATSRFMEAQHDLAARIAALPDVVQGLLTGWAPLVGNHLLALATPWTTALAVGSYVLAVATLFGLVRAARRKTWRTLALVSQAVAALLLACLLRPDVPVYMLYAAFPLVALAATHGLVALSGKRTQWLALCLFALAVPLQLALIVERHATAERGASPFPGEAVADVRAPVRNDAWPRFWLAAHAHHRVADTICEPAGSVALHGEVASAFAWAGNTALQGGCRGAALGGVRAQRHVAGIPAAYAEQLGLSGITTGGFLLTEAIRPLHPEHGETAMVSAGYVVDDYRQRMAAGSTNPVRIDIHCDGSRWLVINNLMAALNPLETTVDNAGVTQSPILTNIAANYFRCPADAQLTATLNVLNPQAVEVFLLD